MKYTIAEQNKLRKLRARIEDARAQLKGLASLKAKAGQKSGSALRKFRDKRKRIVIALRAEERKLERECRVAVSPVLREIRRVRRARNVAIRRVSRVSYAANNRAYVARQYEQRRLAEAQRRAQEARRYLPLDEKEMTLVKSRLRAHHISVKDGKAILYKRVSNNYKTREGRPEETHYKIGTVVTVPNWDPRSQECGSGKLHACYTPKQCDQFRRRPSDKYIAIEIALQDLYAWPNPDYSNKIAFRSGKVLYRCDEFCRRYKRVYGCSM